VQSSGFWWVGEVGGEAGDGYKWLAFWLGGRNGFEEGTGVGVEGVGEEVAAGRAFDDASRIHDVDVVADFRDDGEVVGYEDDGGAEFLLAVFDEVEDLFLDCDVECGSWFVADEELGFCDKSHGDHDALAHSAGELVRVGMDAFFGFRDADFGEGIDGAVEGGGAAHVFVEFERLDDLIADFHVGVQRGHGILEDH
jgi:hypothetical protein